MSGNGDRVLRCSAPDCKSNVLRGTERDDGSDESRPRGHALDADGNPYHFGCMARLAREATAHPLRRAKATA